MLLRIGLTASLLSYLVLLAADSIALFVLAFILVAVGIGFNEPGFTSAMTLAVEANEYGAVSGLTASAVGLSSMIAPLLGTSLYQVNQVLPYLVGAVLVATALAFAWFSPRMRLAAGMARAH
jgi:MFS family permease